MYRTRQYWGWGKRDAVPDSCAAPNSEDLHKNRQKENPQLWCFECYDEIFLNLFSISDRCWHVQKGPDMGKNWATQDHPYSPVSICLCLPLNMGLKPPLKRAQCLSISGFGLTQNTFHFSSKAADRALSAKRWQQGKMTTSLWLPKERSSLQRLCVSAFDFWKDVRISIRERSMNRAGGFARCPKGMIASAITELNMGRGMSACKEASAAWTCQDEGRAGKELLASHSWDRQNHRHSKARPQCSQITVQAQFFSQKTCKCSQDNP